MDGIWAFMSNANVQMFFSAMFGAFVLYTLNRLNERQPFSFFTALQIKVDGPLKTFSDMIISSALGAGVVLLVTHPATVAEAGASGLGLTGILSAFGKDAS
jgi:hypothetical protein